VKPGRDAILGRLAVEKGLITEAELKRCLRSRRGKAGGNGTNGSGSLLVARGLIKARDLRDLAREQERRTRAIESFRQEQKGDYLFGQVLVRNDKATQNQVNKCLEIQEQMAARGTSRIPHLGELLVQHGFVDHEAVVTALKLQNRRLMICTACGRTGATEARRNAPASRCAACGGPLVPGTTGGRRGARRSEEE
jgi:hypothetical protein